MSWFKFVLSSGLLLFVLLGIMYPISKFNDLPQIVVAWGTVMLASVTFLLIRHGREQENRDRKERLLNEVTIWLKELDDHIFHASKIKLGRDILEDVTIKLNSGISPETWYIIEDLDQSLIQLHSLDSGIKEAEYYQKFTLKINEELSKLIEALNKQLQQRRQLVLDSSSRPRSILSRSEILKRVQGESELIQELIEDDTKSLDGLKLSEEGITTVRFARNAGNIKKSIINTIDKVIELKMNLLK